MTVAELITRLQAYPQDARVCVSLNQSEYADMCGIGTDGGADDVYLDTRLDGSKEVYISGDVENQ